MVGRKLEIRVQEALPWKHSANCIDKGRLFFEDNRPSIVSKAKAICAKCEVKEECLNYALTHNEYGVWGGLTANQRRRLRRTTASYGLAK